MEKVENLYRTARTQNDSIDTSGHNGSRLCDVRSAVGDYEGAVTRYEAVDACAYLAAGPMQVFATRPSAKMSSEQFSPTPPPETANPPPNLGTEYEEFYRGIIRLLRR